MWGCGSEWALVLRIARIWFYDLDWYGSCQLTRDKTALLVDEVMRGKVRLLQKQTNYWFSAIYRHGSLCDLNQISCWDEWSLKYKWYHFFSNRSKTHKTIWVLSGQTGLWGRLSFQGDGSLQNVKSILTKSITGRVYFYKYHNWGDQSTYLGLNLAFP